MSFLDIETTILEMLAAERRPRSTQWITSRTKLPVTRVSDTLLRLHREKRVRRTHGLWEATAAVVKRQGPIGDESTDGGTTTRQVPRNGGLKQLDPSQSRKWADFRKLCLYYAECIRLDERPYISAWQSQFGKTWAALTASVNWRSLSGEQPVSVPLTDDIRTIIQSDRDSREVGSFAVGLAIDVFDAGKNDDAGDRLRGVVPIIIVRIWAEIDGDQVILHPVGRPELNQKWLEQKFRTRDRQRAILDELGVLPTTTEEFEDDEEGISEFLELPSVEQTLDRLFVLTRSMWVEPGDISSLRVDPPLQSVDRPGIYNRVIIVSIPKLKYARRLYGELHRIANEATDEDLDKTALRFLFPNPSLGKLSDQVISGDALTATEPVLLNGDQREAVAAALRSDLTVVTGPPGTGKSTVVQTVLANLALRGRPGLFASRNHQGLEAVEPRINSIVEPDRLMLRPVYPFSESSRRFDWQRMMVELLCRPSRPGILEERDAAVLKVHELVREHRTDEERCIEILDLRDQLAEANKDAKVAREDLPESIKYVDRCEFERAPVASLVRLSNLWQHRLARKGWLARLLRKVSSLWIRYRLRQVSKRDIGDPIRDLLTLAIAQNEQGLGGALDVWANIKEVIERERRAEVLEASLRSGDSFADIQETLNERQSLIEEQTKSALALVAASSGAGITPELRERLAALRAGLANHGDALDDNDPFRRQIAKAFAAAMPELLHHYPLWATSNLSVSKAVPLVPAVFDTVIIDEASQCDVASVIPLLFRARRLMVVGDPQQLPHVTQLSKEADLHVRRRLGVADFAFESWTYRVNSLFDIANSRQHAERVELRSHYRCHPAIASYCNDSFYGKSLWVRTSDNAIRSKFDRSTSLRGCTWTHVDGDAKSAGRGSYSPAEIEAVARELSKLAAQDFPGTVGVVTPFRAQADRLRERLFEKGNTSWPNEWKLLIDTADGFQGDERDLMLFSLVASRNMPSGSQGFLASSPNRFNVAVSRARAVLHVLGDSEWARECGIPYIQELWRRCQAESEASRSIRSELIGPVWEPRFAEALREIGLPVEQQYPAGGYFLDIALVRDGLMLDIEVDGETYHRDPITGYRKIDDVYRDIVLRSLGWTVARFWVYELKEDFDGCVERARRAFERAESESARA
ncbi:MAG: DUF559 domain-containing protein [Phycisphaerales bacterium]|nr:DUF559 domain-containing protein [Phycisphaerales bacterium]